MQKPADFAALIALRHKGGGKVKPGKRFSLRGPGQARFKRLDSLDDGYTEDALRTVLFGTKTHRPQGKAWNIVAHSSIFWWTFKPKCAQEKV